MAGLESQQSGKVPFDPGWNDPPPMSFSTQTQKPRNLLNKRVAFPMTPAAAASAILGSPAPGLPSPAAAAPLSVPQPILPHLATPSSCINENDFSIDSELALQKVCDVLYKILENSELAGAALDIRKRIAAMEETWKSGKLNLQAQHKMLKLATALKEERPKEAEELQKVLAVEHTGAVSAWMPAVKRLVYHSIARQDLLSIDKEESD